MTASSTLTEEDGIAYYPKYVCDNDKATAWVEGASGDGIGEYIELDFGTEGTVSSVQLINGYAKSQDIYTKNNRVKKIRLTFSDGTSYELSDYYLQHTGCNLIYQVHYSGCI